jgi:hypothetical protein
MYFDTVGIAFPEFCFSILRNNSSNFAQMRTCAYAQCVLVFDWVRYSLMEFRLVDAVAAVAAAVDCFPPFPIWVFWLRWCMLLL